MEYFGEADFAEWMEREVEPYLKQHGQGGEFHGKDQTMIHYRCYRIPEAEKCIVISHGFCEFAEKYNEMIYYFLQGGYSVYLAEHRGHGYSERSAADIEMVHVENYEDYVQELVFFVKTVVLPYEKEIYLFAHSMGGAVGILTLEQNPGLFRAAVLSSPMCGMRTGRLPGWIACLVAGVFCILGHGKQYAPGQHGFTDKPDFAGSSCVSRERYNYVFNKRVNDPKYRTYGGSYSWVYAGLSAGRKLMRRKNLAKIDVPILLFGAGREHMVINEKIRRFAERTPQVTLVWMPEAKHEIFNADGESRRKYYETIFAFLKKNGERNG